MYALLEAIILGIVEGITEFLPISSTGHLILTERVLEFKDSQDLFTVVIQVGAILAVIWFYRQDLTQKTAGLIRRERDAIRFWKLLALGTIPAGIVGLLLDKSMEHITTPGVIAAALILGGIILWLVDRRPTPRVRTKNEQVDFRELSLRRALLIGLGQCVAIVPGVSRSGATIVSGLATGLNRPTATAFSFYLSIPVLILASGYKLAKYSDSIHTLPGGAGALIIGLIFAFITALFAISWLLKYISHHSFRPFAYYRIGLGLLVAALLATGTL
jgi:undecaprenyl-diphosphatase